MGARGIISHASIISHHHHHQPSSSLLLHPSFDLFIVKKEGSLFENMKVSILFLLFFLVSFVDAFAPPPSSLPHYYHHHYSLFSSKTRLFAEDEAPKYTTRDVILKKAELVGDGSAVLLHVDRLEDDDEPFTYEPGHVLALEIQYNATRDGELNTKIKKDTENNNGWMRAPYTVSTANQKHLNILIQIVGTKSKAFAAAANNTPLRLGGKFKTPIVQGISSENTKRVCLLSTGVGIGPCVGAVEKLIYYGQEYPYVVDLVASFRFPSQVIYTDYLNVWSEAYEGKFYFYPVVTHEVGRISSSEKNIETYVVNKDFCSLTETHYHLIGNGQMVNEWKAGLLQAGVPKEKITFEIYFNHKEEPSEEAIERIATVMKAAALNPAK